MQIVALFLCHRDWNCRYYFFLSGSIFHNVIRMTQLKLLLCLRIPKNAWIYLKCWNEADEVAYDSCIWFEYNIVIEIGRAWGDATQNPTRLTVCLLRPFGCSMRLRFIFKDWLRGVMFCGSCHIDYWKTISDFVWRRVLDSLKDWIDQITMRR